MSRDAITVNTLTGNGAITASNVYSHMNHTNGANVQLPTTAVPASPVSDHLVLICTSASGDSTAHNFTIRAGVGGGATPGAAFRSGLGDLVVSVADGATKYVGPLEPARFLQTDGSINIDFDSALDYASSTSHGSITALLVPNRGY